jgi:hypothetical protein
MTVLETPHVAVGAAIATAIPNPLIAIPLAFGSHFILEQVPHWNPHLNTELKKHGKITKQSMQIIIFDSSLALILGSWIAYQALPDTAHALTIFFACFASVLPDVVEGPYFFLKLKNKFIMKWISFQKSIQRDTSVVPGVTTQIVTVIAALWWILG